MKKFLSLFAAVLLAGSVVADTFGLLTDASDLAAGDQIIIVNAEGTFAMSTTQNTNNRGLAAVEVEDNLIEPSASVQIITLEADGSNWKFNVGDDAYLYAASSSSNYLKTNTAATVGDNGKWKITIDGEGLAEIVAQGGNTRNRMLYNSSNSIISCYGANSTQAKCKIYKKGGTPQATVEYYLVGTMNSWEPATGYKFSKNTAAEGEEYKLDVTLEANAEFKGRKVVDGVADAWYPDNCQDCNFTVATAGDYTIYLRPNGDGGGDWHNHVLYAEYHEPVVLPTITCAEVNTADNGTAAKLNTVSVVYVGEGDAKYCYIADESGMTLLYKNGHGLQAGKLVSGIEGAVSIYSQLHEFVPSNTIDDWTVTDAGVIPTFAEQTTAPAANQENQIIVLKGVFVDNTVTFSTTSVGSNVTAHIGEADFVMRNTFKVGMTLEQGKLYDVTGAVSRYNSTIQFIPISAEEETVDPGTVEYYLAGWINSDEYAYGDEAESQSEYKFVNNRIVVNFDEEAYLLVRTYENTPKFYGAAADVESEEETFEAVLAEGREGMVTIPANREATIEISIDESGVMTMSVALAHSYTCAEINAAAKNTVANLNPVAVVYVGENDNRYCYVADESGMTLIYVSDVEGVSVTPGQLVSGIKGTVDVYNGLPELKSANKDKWVTGIANIPDFQELAEAPGVEMVNQIVVLKNVSVAEDVTFTTDGVNNANATIAGATIKLRNTFKVPMTLEASKMYDLTVAVARYARNETDEIQFFPIAAQEVDVPVVEKHYYLIGIDMWDVEALTEERELVLNEEAETVEYKIDWTLEQGNEFKIVEWDGADGQIWYPDGENNNYVVDAAHAGPSTIYFRPLKDGGDDWHYNYIYVETHPVEHHYYLMGIDVWSVADLTEDRLLVKNEGTDANEYMINWTLAEGNEFQIVDWDGEEGQTWFPGGSANYVVDAAHAGAATIYFRPYRDGDEAWHEGCIYVQVAEVEKHYYLMGIDVWNVADLTEDRLLVKNEGTDANEYMINWTLAEGNEFQIVEWDGEEGQTWFPGGENNNYVVDAAHAGDVTIYFRPNYDGGADWHQGCIYVYKYLGPTSKAADPEWPALQVKAVYSDTYDADCNFGWWDSYTTYEQTEYGKHYTTTDLGYFGLAFEDRTLNCSNMEALHLDVWSETDMSMRVVPIYASDADMGITINITAGQWNAIELPFTSEEWANMGEHWSNIYQIKIDNARNVSFWLDNVYFYTTVEPELDEEVPTNVVAQAGDASYFTAYINASAEDNSGEVIFAVMNDELQLATATANSGQEITISVTGLAAGTEYTLKVVAKDPQQNMAEPVEVVVNTLAAPTSAPQPVYAAEDVLAIYGPAYEATVGWWYENWWSGATQMEGMLSDGNNALCYIPSTEEGGCFSWSFNPQDVTAYSKIALDIYPTNSGSALFRIVNVLGDDVPVELEGGQWNHIELDIAGNTQTQFQQIGILNYKGLGDFFVQNVLFVKEPVVYNYFMVGDFCGWDLANAVMFEDVEGVLAAMIPSMTGKFKIVKCAGETAQWGDEFGAHTEGDVIALDPQGEYILKHNDSRDLKVEGRYNNAVFTLTESEGEMVLHFVAGTVDENIYFSIAGDMNGWNNNDNDLTFTEVEGVLRLEVEEVHGEFKVVVKGDWHPQAGGPVGAEVKDVLTLGEAYNMTLALVEGQPDASNLLFAPVGYGYHNAVLELSADMETATVSITLVSGELYDTSSNPKTYQVVGAFNNWDAASAIEFEEVEGVLTATVEDLNGTFKIIQDHAWTNQWATNWETGARLGFNEPYVLGAKTETAEPANLALVNLFGGYHNAVLTLDPETMTLTLVQGESYRVEADWYVPGAWQNPDWKCNENSKMSPVEGQENTFELLQPEFGKAFKVVYGEWMVEFGAAVGSGATWMLDQDIELATPCDNLNSAYGDQMLQDVTITIVVDYENGAVTLHITSEGEVQPTLYYIKNNWNGGEWEWKQMTPSNNGDEWMFEGVFGGTGVNINTSMSDEGAIWFPVGEAYEGHVIEGDAIEAGQTVRFVYSVSAGTLTATIIETGIENVVLDAVKAQKMLIDGHIYIIRDGRMFNVQGARVR